MRISAVDEAQNLYKKFRSTVGNTVNKVGSFVKSNPTPAAYVNQQFQQKVAQPVARTVVQKVGPSLSTYQAPLEQKSQQFTQKVGSYLGPQGQQTIQNAFPITQIPFNVGEQIRSVGRVASGKPTGLDLAQIGFSATGIIKPKVPQGFTKQSINFIRKAYSPEVRGRIGQFAQMVEQAPTTINRKNLGSLGDEIQTIAEATFGKKATNLTNRQLKNLFDTAMEEAFRKGTPSEFPIGLQAKPIRSVQAAEKAKKALEKGRLLEKTPIDTQSLLKNGEGGSSSRSIIPQVDNPTDPYFNVNRLNVKPQVKQAVKTAVMETKPSIEKMVGKKLSNKEVVDLANRTSKVLHSAVSRDQTLQWESSMLKARQILADEAGKGTVTPEFMNALMTIKSQGTDIARKLQSLGIGADAQTVTTKQVMLDAILKQTDKVDEVLKAANGVDFNDFKQASEFYRKFIKPTREEWLDTLRYNAMLSSPNTHFNNIASNVQGTGIVAPIEKTLTGTFDWLRSSVTGKDRKYLAGEGLEYAKGYYSNLGTAAKRFGDVMKGNVMGSYPELRDIPLSAGGKGKFRESALKLPQRLLEAADQFFTTLTSEGSKRSLGYRASKGINVRDIAGKAGEEADYRLFRQNFGQPKEGPLLRSVEFIPEKIMEAKNSSNPVIRTTAKLSFPFVRIAVNLFKQGIEYSPAGIATIPGVKEKLPQFTKAFMGSMVGVGAAMLASSDRLSWAAPSSEKQRQLWDKAGMQEYSVKWGDTWISYSKLHPVLAFNLATVAGVKQALDNQKIDDGTADTLLTSLSNVMRFYADQSYVKNIGDFISATEQGASGLPKLASNYAQQYVPYRAFLGWLARTLDPVQRTATKDANAIQKQMEYFFMQIPGLRQTLPEKTDIEGNAIENKNRFINAVSPARISTNNEDYENAYRIQKNLPKIEQAKKQAIELYLSGDKQKAQDLKKEHGFSISSEDIKRSKTTQTNKAAELYVEGKKDEAKRIKQQYNLTINQNDITKAAKKKAVEFYKLGLKDEAMKLKREYKFNISQNDLD